MMKQTTYHTKSSLKKYYKKSTFERILNGENQEDPKDTTNEDPTKPRTKKKQVVIIFEDDPERPIPREPNHDNPFASDELTLTSESDDVNQ